MQEKKSFETKKVAIIVHDAKVKGISVSDGIEVWVIDQDVNLHKQLSVGNKASKYYEFGGI